MSCQATSDNDILLCDLDRDHAGDWHWDSTDNVTWRSGNHTVFRRACCDHCSNAEGPEGHDYTLDGPHDGPCEQCAHEQARREHDAGTGD